jgi:hypothetical protein
MSAAYGGTFSLGAPGVLPGHTAVQLTSGFVQSSGDPLVTPFHYTFSVLFRITGAPVACYAWMYASGNNGNTEYSFIATEPDTTANVGQTHAANAYDQLFSVPSVGNGVWHQFASSWDGTQLKAYLDGALAGAVPASVFFRGGSITLGMGGAPLRTASAGTRLNGFMSSGAVFHSALSDAQIANQFQVLSSEAVSPIGQAATSGQIVALGTQIASLLSTLGADIAAIIAALTSTYHNAP